MARSQPPSFTSATARAVLGPVIGTATAGGGRLQPVDCRWSRDDTHVTSQGRRRRFVPLQGGRRRRVQRQQRTPGLAGRRPGRLRPPGLRPPAGGDEVRRRAPVRLAGRHGAAGAVRAHSAPPEGSRPKDTGGTAPATIPVSPVSDQMAIFGRESLGETGRRRGLRAAPAGRLTSRGADRARSRDDPRGLRPGHSRARLPPSLPSGDLPSVLVGPPVPLQLPQPRNDRTCSASGRRAWYEMSLHNTCDGRTAPLGLGT